MPSANARKREHPEQRGGSYGDVFDGNTFTIPRSDVDLTQAYGIYNFNSLHYSIINNTFNDADAGGSYNIGVISRGLKKSVGDIWGNNFNGLVIGNQTEMWNKFLKIRCNVYDEYNTLCWAVNPYSQGLVLGPQGTSCAPSGTRAGNEFNTANTNHIWNWAQPFLYIFSDDDLYNPYPIFNLTLPGHCNNVSETSCSEFLGVGGEEIVIAEELMNKVEWDEVREDFEGEYTTVEGSLDNGQKTTMLTNIANSGYSNSTLTADLISNSPLSDEVLTEACQRISFSTQQKIDFLVPNCPVSSEVWEEVEKAFAGPVHTDIVTAQNESSVRTLTAINADYAAAETEYIQAVNKVLFYYADNNEIDSLTWYLHDTIDSKESHQMLVASLLEFGNDADARTVLEAITPEDANDDAFYDYYDVALTLADESKTWFEMDAGQIEDIQALAATEYEVAVNAQAVLTLLYDSVYTRIPEILPESKWDGLEEPSAQTQEENSLKKIGVYPNPSNNNFTVNYVFEQEAAEMRVEVYDLLGRNLFTQQVDNTLSGNININLAECLGVYVLRIYADEKQVHKEKLICIQK